MKVQATITLFALVSLVACGSGAGPTPAPMAAGTQGQATDYLVASREARTEYAGLVPQGVRPSAIRLGNDRCYYYVAGATIEPLISNTGGQVCL